jgi:hypothetical protein
LAIHLLYNLLFLAVSRSLDLAEYLSSDPKVQDAHPHTSYDLIANICHEGEPGTLWMLSLCIYEKKH